MDIVKKMADFVVQTNFDALPTEAVTAAKRAMLDALGVALAGSAEPPSKIITDYIRKIGGVPNCGVIAGKMKTSAPNAALANGVMGHVLDYDDTNIPMQGHPSVPLFATLLALGEELGCSGKEIIAAYVLGAEVWARIAQKMPMLNMKGWHSTAIFGTLGTGVAAAKLMNLNSEQTMMVMGLAGSQAGGVLQNNGTYTKSFHAGKAARNGIEAALLVKDGFTASQNILEGQMGFPKAFFGGEAVEVGEMADNLGHPFTVVSPGINVKKFPCCYATHRAIDAMLYLAKEHNLKPEDVEAIECEIPPQSAKTLVYERPRNSLEAKFSMQFCMAVALADRKVGLTQITDDKTQSALIKDLEKKVTVHVNPNALTVEDSVWRAKHPDLVTVKLRNGKECTHGVLMAKGHANAPLTWEELLEKYNECAGKVLDDQRVERTIELMCNMENLRGINELSNIITGFC